MAGGRGPGEFALGGTSDSRSVEIIGVGGGRADPDDHQGGERVGGSRPTGFVVVAGVVAVVGLLWLLGRPGPSEEAGEEPGPTTPTTLIPVPTTNPSPTVPTTEPIIVFPPVVGELTGLTLFVGGDGPLQSLDLDSGLVTKFGVAAHPVLVTGDDLVLYQGRTGVVGWVPLQTPSQQVLSWKRGQAAPGSGPGLLWILDPSTDEPHPAGPEVEVGFGRWELFDTATNRRVMRVPGDLYDDVEAILAARPPVGGVFDALRPGPELSSRRDGVYRAIDDGYAMLTNGRLIAIGNDAILVEHCPLDDESCDVAWLDVETGAPIERTLPEVRPRTARLLAGGTWLHSVGWGGTSELLELATGRRFEHDWATARPTLSPDGRWLAEWSGDVVSIFDLEVDGLPTLAGRIEAFETDGPGSLLFAETPVARAPGGAATS